MMFNMESVSSQNSITQSHLTQDALPGIGIIKFVLLAQRIGPSMPIKFAFPSLINVKLTEITVPAFHASRVTTLKKVLAFSLHSTTPSLLIPDVPPGIGTTKFALAAQRTGPSTLIKFAFQFLTNALLMLIMELVFHASRDMTLKKELVFSLHSTMLNPLTLDAPPGIGTIKFALLAPNTGFSMPTKSVSQFLTNAPPTEIMEPAFHASKDTILRTEPVFSHHSTMPSLLTLDVPPGIGTIKSALAALNTGFSMEIRSVFPFLTNALLMLTTVLVFHASKDTILRTEPVNSLHSTMLILLTLVALPGIGIIKSVLAAPRDGSSTQRRDAFP